MNILRTTAAALSISVLLSGCENVGYVAAELVKRSAKMDPELIEPEKISRAMAESDEKTMNIYLSSFLGEGYYYLSPEQITALRTDKKTNGFVGPDSRGCCG